MKSVAHTVVVIDSNNAFETLGFATKTEAAECERSIRANVPRSFIVPTARLEFRLSCIGR